MVNIISNIANRFIWFSNVDRKHKNRINYNYFRQIRALFKVDKIAFANRNTWSLGAGRFILRFAVVNYSISKENVVLTRYSIDEFNIFGI